MTRPPRTRVRACTTCGEDFISERSDKGRWRATCSPACRLEAFDRLLSVLLQRRAELARQVEEP